MKIIRALSAFIKPFYGIPFLMTGKDHYMYIYIFFNKQNEVLYVGQTLNLRTRIQNHIQYAPWAEEISRIQVSVDRIKTKVDLDFYERYYINIHRPKYNKKLLKPALNFVDYRIDEIEIESSSKRKQINRLMALEPREDDVFIGSEGKIPLLDWRKSRENPCTSIRYYVGPLDYFCLDTTHEITDLLKWLITSLILHGSTTYQHDSVDFKASFSQLSTWLCLPPGEWNQQDNIKKLIPWISLSWKSEISGGGKPLIGWEFFDECIIISIKNLPLIRQRILLPGNAII